ncbi:MAG TPA: TlyA family RNA methyltransferase [Candidatus Sulfotelmatobacter sp.]|nr:TlyA family RNA methyltransferase [Candidatus Sulfotelmatobacter sp.]
MKLEHALKEFPVEVKEKTVLDVGASTGGFTDCLLQRGAAKVYTVDVGYGILAWKLRTDPRVIVLERTNIRNLTKETLLKKTPNSELPTPNLAVIDVSFISLTKVLPVVYGLLAEKAEVIALIKPQFEARREQVPRGGVIKDQAVRDETVERIKKAAVETGFKLGGLTQSPIQGADGNIEYLIWLRKE